MNKKINLALTGGGTGGHIIPVLSIHNYLKEDKKYNFFWIGERDSLEEKIAKENDIKFLNSPAGRFRRYFDIRNFYEPLKNITGFFYSIYYILKYKIDIIFSKGGYVSVPLCLAGFILRKKIYIHESDSVTGFSNKIISKLATKVFYSFPNKKIKDLETHILSGHIFNPDLIEGLKSIEVHENEILEVLVIAGSQGSTRIFNSLIKILPDFLDVNFTVILGTKNLSFREKFKKFENVKTYDFLGAKNLGNIYKNTDIAITRGSSSLWELSKFGIHSIIIPLTESAGNHQQKNAIYFNKKYGSDILDENNELEINLYKKLKKYKYMRKKNLNLDDFFRALKIIEREIKS